MSQPYGKRWLDDMKILYVRPGNPLPHPLGNLIKIDETKGGALTYTIPKVCGSPLHNLDPQGIGIIIIIIIILIKFLTLPKSIDSASYG